MSSFVAELEAMWWVLGDIGEETDSMSPEDAATCRASLVSLAKKLGEVRALVDDQLKATLEQPKVIGTSLYAVKRDGKWRPDHDVIKSNVITASAYDRETGELRDALDSARIAVDFVYGLFVADKTEPKETGLKALGLSKKDATRYEATGKKLVVTDLDHPEDAA